MTEQFKRGDFVVFNNQFGFPNMQKELEDYYANYGISVGDIGKVSRRNTNGWIRIKFNDTIVSMRQHDLIKYNDNVKDINNVNDINNDNVKDIANDNVNDINNDNVEDIAKDIANDNDSTTSHEVIIESNDDWTTPDSSITEDNVIIDDLYKQINLLNEKVTNISNLSETRQVIHNARVKDLEEKNNTIMERMDKFETIITMIKKHGNSDIQE